MALKSNSKKARENIRKYCLDSSRDYLIYDYDYTEEEVDNSIYSIIWDCFQNEKVKFDQMFKAGRITLQDLFIDYAAGLPLGGLFDYYLNNAIETLGGILEESETEKAKYSESEAELYLTKLIYREVSREALK